MAIGLGAFGHHFEDCEQRFGEFLSVAGAAAYQPTDGSNVPDYLIAEGSFIPELQVLYALVCKGLFASLARFEANSEPGAVPLSDLAEAALEISGAATAGIAMIAESAGLIGAALRQAPTQSAFKGELFHYPEARRWLSFSPEHSHMRSLAVIAGVASRTPGRTTRADASANRAGIVDHRPLPRRCVLIPTNPEGENRLENNHQIRL